MRELSDDDRELLLLVSWEGLSPSEAAKVLGISALATRSRLHRARRRLLALVENLDSATTSNSDLDVEEAG
jgi:RNA polymerase sigma-70 factor (ECF subfamily)